MTTLTASLLLFVSIRGSNATLASLIEITYPFFVALFSWLCSGSTSGRRGWRLAGS